MEYLTTLIASLVTTEIRERRKRMLRSAWLHGLAGFLFLTGYMAIIALAAVYFEGHYGVVKSFLIVTATTIFPALLLSAGVVIANRNQKKRHKEINAQYLSIARTALGLAPQLVSPRSLTVLAAIGILTAVLDKLSLDKSDGNS